MAGVRDRAILETLYGCGLRVSEAASLRISGLYFEDGFVRVVGKGNKERIVPLGEIAAESIGSYLQVRPLPRDAESDDILFELSWARHEPCVYFQPCEEAGNGRRHIQGDIPAYFQAFFRDSSYRERG